MGDEDVEDEVFIDVEDAEQIGFEDQGTFDPEPSSWMKLPVR